MNARTAQLNPHISVDCVVFGYNKQHLKVLLVERDLSQTGKNSSPMHDLKLPGSLVFNDELLQDAAKRVLKDLTGLENIFLEQFDVLDSLDRISNKLDKEWLEQTTGLAIDRVISVAFYGIVHLENDVASAKTIQARWVPIDETDQLPFDHSEIIWRAYTLLRNRIINEDIAFDLLPKKFSIAELQQVMQVFMNTTLDSRNFRKKLKTMDYIVPLNEKQHFVAHKPAQLYKFDKRRYQQYRKRKNSGIL